MIVGYNNYLKLPNNANAHGLPKAAPLRYAASGNR